MAHSWEFIGALVREEMGIASVVGHSHTANIHAVRNRLADRLQRHSGAETLTDEDLSLTQSTVTCELIDVTDNDMGSASDMMSSSDQHVHATIRLAIDIASSLPFAMSPAKASPLRDSFPAHEAAALGKDIADKLILFTATTHDTHVGGLTEKASHGRNHDTGETAPTATTPTPAPSSAPPAPAPSVIATTAPTDLRSEIAADLLRIKSRKQKGKPTTEHTEPRDDPAEKTTHTPGSGPAALITNIASTQRPSTRKGAKRTPPVALTDVAPAPTSSAEPPSASSGGEVGAVTATGVEEPAACGLGQRRWVFLRDEKKTLSAMFPEWSKGAITAKAQENWLASSMRAALIAHAGYSDSELKRRRLS